MTPSNRTLRALRRLLWVWPDLVLLVCAWCFAIWCLGDLWLSWNPSLYYMMGALLTPLVNVIWVQIRIAPEIAALADRRLREEMALTLRPAGEFLGRRLKHRYFSAYLPLGAAWTSLHAGLIGWIFWAYSEHGNRNIGEEAERLQFIVQGLTFLSVGILSAMPGLILLLRYCRGQIAFSLPTVVIWSAAAMFMPMGGVYVPLIALDFSGLVENLALLGAFGAIFAVATLVASIFAVRKLWRRCCAAYYVFD